MRGFDGSTRPWRFGLASLLGLTALLPLGSAGAAPCRLPNRCAQPETITFLAGSNDAFAPPSEAARPSAELSAFLASINAPLRNFDDPAADLHLAHTFTGLPTGVCGARLTLSACAVSSLASNDSLFLERTATGWGWGQTLPVVTNTAWTANLCAPNLALDLGALPLGFGNNTDVLWALTDGDLDLYLQDDTRVDFARLEVDRCPPAACAPPPRGLRAWWPLDETTGTLAHDIAGSADGTHTNGPVPVAGAVAGALSFDGVNDHIVVPDQAALDVGASPGGDFSVDFWIRTSQTTGIHAILEKRGFEPNEKGWTVFLSSGRLGLQLAEGGFGFCDSTTPMGCTNYDSGVTIATGQWVFVAVTVDRDSTTGIRWYVNGQSVGVPGNPTLRPGSLANSAPLLIGKHLNNGAAFLAGALDEVELFDRALSQPEIQAIGAAPLGKCKTRVVQNWDIPICSNLPTTSAQPQICNDSTELRSFGVTFAGSPAGPGCSVAGPTNFTIGIAQPVLVPPSSCVSVPVTITRPAGLGAGQTACFEIRAEDLATGQVASKKTSIWNTGAICCLPVSSTTAVPLDRSIPVRFNVQNLGATPRTLNFELQSMPSDPEREVVSLDGLPAGEPVRGQLLVPARSSTEIETDVELLDFLPFNQQDLLLVDRDTNAVLASTALSSFAPGCTPDATTLCLNGGRFRVNAVWRDFAGRSGQGQAVPLTADTGYFWFFSPENIELVLKVLDGRPLNDQWWVFYGALSSVEYTLTVTDTVTGATRSYTNPSGRLASVADVSALPGDEPGSRSEPVEGALPAAVELEPRAGGCAGGPTTLCLQQGRFRLEVAWRTPNGATGAGMAVPLTNDSGYFWFFNAANVELVVKVLDGTPINQSWWLFYGALSDVDYTLTLTDTMTGASKTYRNPQGNLASVADTRALPQ